MRKYKEIFHKKTQQYEFRFFTLNKLDTKDSLSEFLSIIDIFELNKADFVGSCFVSQEETLLDDISNIDRNIVFRIKEGKQKSPREIIFHFNGMQLNEIIKLTAKNYVPIYIISTHEKDGIPGIEIISNDREFSAITFCKDLYEHDKINSKIEHILG